MKILREGAKGEYLHYCLGCRGMHMINTQQPNMFGAQWSFNMDMDKPTFEPSVNIGPSRCHYNITAGFIIYHTDCQHELAGHTLELPNIPEYYL